MFTARADLLHDLHVFDPVSAAWTDLSTMISGNVPAIRSGFSLTSSTGRLYVYAGWGGHGMLVVLTAASSEIVFRCQM